MMDAQWMPGYNAYDLIVLVIGLITWGFHQCAEEQVWMLRKLTRAPPDRESKNVPVN